MAWAKAFCATPSGSPGLVSREGELALAIGRENHNLTFFRFFRCGSEKAKGDGGNIRIGTNIRRKLPPSPYHARPLITLRPAERQRKRDIVVGGNVELIRDLRNDPLGRES